MRKKNHTTFPCEFLYCKIDVGQFRGCYNNFEISYQTTNNTKNFELFIEHQNKTIQILIL